MTTSQRPDFAIALRGYDRAQVDEFVAHQTARLGFAETRAQQAAASAAAAREEVDELRSRLAQTLGRGNDPAPRPVQAIGDRVNAILESATQAADEMRAEAQQEAERVRSQAAEMGRADAERSLAELRAAHGELERATSDLSRRRDATVAELDRLRAVLESALSSIMPGALRPRGPSAGPSSDETVIDLDAAEREPESPDTNPARIHRVQ